MISSLNSGMLFYITEGAFREETKLIDRHTEKREREQLAGLPVLSAPSHYHSIHARLVTELPHSNWGDLVWGRLHKASLYQSKSFYSPHPIPPALSTVCVCASFLCIFYLFAFPDTSVRSNLCHQLSKGRRGWQWSSLSWLRKKTEGCSINIL